MLGRESRIRREDFLKSGESYILKEEVLAIFLFFFFFCEKKGTQFFLNFERTWKEFELINLKLSTFHRIFKK